VGTLKRNRPLIRPRPKYEDNIKVNLKQIAWTWTGLMWLRSFQRVSREHGNKYSVFIN